MDQSKKRLHPGSTDQISHMFLFFFFLPYWLSLFSIGAMACLKVNCSPWKSSGAKMRRRLVFDFKYSCLENHDSSEGRGSGHSCPHVAENKDVSLLLVLVLLEIFPHKKLKAIQ